MLEIYHTANNIHYTKKLLLTEVLENIKKSLGNVNITYDKASLI